MGAVTTTGAGVLENRAADVAAAAAIGCGAGADGVSVGFQTRRGCGAATRG
jgi:hypothetical protein